MQTPLRLLLNNKQSPQAVDSRAQYNETLQTASTAQTHAAAYQSCSRLNPRPTPKRNINPARSGSAQNPQQATGKLPIPLSFLFRCIVRLNSIINLHITTSQEISTTPQKAPHLPGRGRGGRRLHKQKNQDHKLQNLTQLTNSNFYSISSKNNLNTHCTCLSLILQEYSPNMATSGHRKVARVLMAEEEEFMEIDSLQGSALKTNTGKTVDSTETSNKKKSKSGELLYTSAPEKQDRRYWLGFNYMEQLAIEVGTPECHSDGPVEDLVTQGYLQNEAEELE
jgi:hypothetical protein